MTKKRKRHTPEQIVKKLRDAEVMLNAGKGMTSSGHATRMLPTFGAMSVGWTW